MTTDELSLNEADKCSEPIEAPLAPEKQEVRAELSASPPALPPETTAKPEVPAVCVLSNIIIQRYEGGLCGNVFHGEGVAYFRGGHVYKGTFVDGFMHGHGEFTWADGVKYKGDFQSNVLMGHGTYTWVDCSTYEGEICNGICHGVGTHKSPKTSTVYQGQWYKSQRHGKGTMFYNPEATSWYKGDWKNNQKEGWGIRCYSSGDTYEGQWKNGVRHGEGTMKWIQLGQQYIGQWLNGVQNGHGTHSWFQRRVSSSQYPYRNEYKGEFVQGLRHGQGAFFYASGAVYAGCWKDNKKHGQGKFVFKNGRIYEGEFINDRMAQFPASSSLSLCVVHGIPCTDDASDSAALQLGPDTALSIEKLLNQIPEAQRGHELRQVEFAIMRHIVLLRQIYSLYSRLGQEKSPDNTFMLNYLQFHRFLKDCHIYQHGLTLPQLDHFINGYLQIEDVSPEELNSPFRTILLRKWISRIVIAAYHIYHRDFESSSCVIAESFLKLMKQNVIPNAKNVKGPLYCHPPCGVILKKHTERCWEIYQTVPKVNSASRSDIMTARHFIWMFKDLGLLDCTLTAKRLLDIISLENPALYCSTHSNLDLEITFLEFIEALVASAEVKNTHGFGTAQQKQHDLTSHDETSAEQTNDGSIQCQLTSPQNESTALLSSITISNASTCTKSLEPATQSARIEEIQHGEAAEEGLPEQTQKWINRVHQFFTCTFFPAYEHNLALKKVLQEERQKQSMDYRITLEKAKELREQRRVDEEKKEKEEEDEEKSHAIEDPNDSSATLPSSVTTSKSVKLKPSHTSKKKKKK